MTGLAVLALILGMLIAVFVPLLLLDSHAPHPALLAAAGVAVGIAIAGWGVYELLQQEAAEEQACRDRGGVPIDQYKARDLCVAPGTIR
jgi:xanthosine utilization system XapX-like protein